MEAPSPVGSASPPGNTILCLYCRATIYFPGLPANRYLNHLFAEHNIMYEVQSVINRTLALQLPKEFPELADGSVNLPDSSNRLTSPAPSSVGGASPAPQLITTTADRSTQTEEVETVSTETQANFDDLEVDDVVEKPVGALSTLVEPEPSPPAPTITEDAIMTAPSAAAKTEPTTERTRRAERLERAREEIRVMLEKAGRTRKNKGVTCEICSTKYKKLYKLKFHLTKHHLKDMAEKYAKDEARKESLPERKSSRIEHKKEEDVKKLDKKTTKEKKETSTTSEQRDIPDSLLVAPEEEWTEGCQYFCMLCSRNFSSFGVYKHHIGDYHSMLIEEYRAKFGKHGEVINRLTCTICNVEMVHKHSAVKMHLKSVHNMTISEYKKILDTGGNPSKKCEPSLVSTASSSSPQVFVATAEKEMKPTVQGLHNGDTEGPKSPDPLSADLETMPSLPDQSLEDAHNNLGTTAEKVEVGDLDLKEEQREEDEEDLEEDEESEGGSGAGGGGRKRWYEGCSYQCLACNRDYSIYFSYHGHIKKIHNLSMDQYHAKYGLGGETNRYYSCKICKVNVVWRLFNIRKHMEAQHSLSLAQYGGKYEVEESEAASDDTTTSPTGQRVLRVVVKDYMKGGEKSEASSEGEKPWHEGCLFSCQAEGCSKIFQVQDTYSSHVSLVHGLSLEEYRKKYGTKGEVYTQYQCRMCNAKISHRYNNIASHITLVHDLNMTEYGEKYHSNNQNKVLVRRNLRSVDSRQQESLQITEGEEEAGHFVIEEGEVEEMELDGPPYEFTEDDIIIEEPLRDGEEEEEEEEGIDDEEPTDVGSVTGVVEGAGLAVGGAAGEGHAWYHGSNLTCKICYKNFANDQWYFHHFSKIHGITKEQYNEKYGKDAEIYHQYQCLICNSEIRWKYSSIRQHLKQVHSTTIQDYEAKYMDSDPEAFNLDQLTALRDNRPANPCHDVSTEAKAAADASPAVATGRFPPPPPLKASPAALAAGRAATVGAMTTRSATPQQVFTPPPPLSTAKGSLTFASRPESQWYHGSDLQCLICNKSFVDFTYYCTHIRTTHSIPKDQYNDKYGTAAEAFRLYKCLVCNMKMKWTYQSICAHLKSHNLTIKDYESQYTVLSGQSVQSGKIAELTRAGGNLANTSMEEEEEEGEEEVSPSQVSKRPRLSRDCGPGSPAGLTLVAVPIERLTGKSPGKQFSPNSSGILDQSEDLDKSESSAVTGKWYNQCKFTCKACPEEKFFTVPQALRMHLNGIHSLSRKEYEARYGNAETVTRYWTCLICMKELKCQKGIIIQHLLNVHTMELIDYERQYVDPADQVVSLENRKPRKNGRVPLPPPTSSTPTTTAAAAASFRPILPKPTSDNGSSGLISQDSGVAAVYEEGADSFSLEGEAVAQEMEEGEVVIHPSDTQSQVLDDTITSISTLEVEGMEYVPWYFGCRYGCQICNKVWHYPQACRYHLDSVHKLSRAQYEVEYGSCEVETRIFHCSICQRSMKCERDIIKYHLEAKHSMSLEEYQEQVPSPVVTVGESRRSNAANQERQAVASRTGNTVPSPAANGVTTSPVTSNQGVTSAPWYRGSNFTCIPCSRQFTAQVSYISHINSRHGMNLKEYREQYGAQEEIKQYTCRIPLCGKQMSWTYSGINDHLKSHGLSMAEYERLHHKAPVGESLNGLTDEGLKQKAEAWSSGPIKSCKICHVVQPNQYGAMAAHLAKQHEASDEDIQIYLQNEGKKSGHTCHICQELVDHSTTGITKHLNKHGVELAGYYKKFIESGLVSVSNTAVSSTTSKGQKLGPSLSPSSKSVAVKVGKNHWANGCSYQCILCPGQQFPEEFVFKKHISHAHNLLPEEYQNNFGSPAVSLKLHNCRVCNKDVKHEYTAILNHLRVKHNITLTLYTQTYIKPNQNPGISSTSPLPSEQDYYEIYPDQK